MLYSPLYATFDHIHNLLLVIDMREDFFVFKAVILKYIPLIFCLSVCLSLLFVLRTSLQIVLIGLKQTNTNLQCFKGKSHVRVLGEVDVKEDQIQSPSFKHAAQQLQVTRRANAQITNSQIPRQ